MLRDPGARDGGKGGRLLLPAAFLVLAGCSFPRIGKAPPVRIPPAPGKELPLAEKARGFEAGLDARHLLPWGGLAYRVRLPDGPGGRVRVPYLSDQACWTGVLLGAECERWAAVRAPAALERVRRTLTGISVLADVTGERGLFARYARTADPDLVEPYPGEWHDGSAGFEGWRWRGDTSKDQVAGLLYGLAAVGDLVEDPWARGRAARLLGDLADRVLGRGCGLEDVGGRPTTHGDLRPRVHGFPVGVNAAIVLGLADAAARATGDPRHRRTLEGLLAEGADAALRYPTIRVLGKENWNNPNMTALALASILRAPVPPGDAARARLRAAAAGAMRRVLGLHRGEGNAFWIAVAAAAGADAGASPADLEAALASLARFPADLTECASDHRGRSDLGGSFWTSRRGRQRLRVPLRVDEMSPGSFCWKNDPYEALQEESSDGKSVYSGVDFLAAYWPLRRLGILGPDR